MSVHFVDSLKAVVSRSQPVLLFLAGSNGSGKTSFFKTYVDGSDVCMPFVNADEIAAHLRFTQHEKMHTNVEQLAFSKAEEIRRLLLEERQSFCAETVFSDPVGAKIEFLHKARASGYVVFLIFIGLDSSVLSLARVIQRVAQGGHDVPDQKLRERFPRTLANLKRAIPLVDEAFLFDNSSDLTPFRLIARYFEGELVEKHEPLPLWADFL